MITSIITSMIKSISISIKNLYDTYINGCLMNHNCAAAAFALNIH